MRIANMDFASAEHALLAAQIAGAIDEEAEMEKAPAHIQSFYRRMMGLLDSKGIEGNNQAAKSMKALAMREQRRPPRPERFGKQDRQKAVKKLVEEGTIQQPKTRRTKNTPAAMDPAAIDKFLETLPDELKESPEAVTAAIGRVFGFRSPEAQMRASLRANRFLANNPGKRLPSHIRSAAVMSTAVMAAVVALFPDQQEEATVGAVAALRQQFATIN